MATFTAVCIDDDYEERHVIVCDAKAADDVPDLIKDHLFVRSINEGDTTVDADDTIKNCRAGVNVDILAVFEGEHQNLHTPEGDEVHYTKIPTGWTFDIESFRKK